jgi:hypothetical protein
MCKGIIDIWHPKTLIDVGCSIGDLVKEYLDKGIDARGIEGNPACIKYLVCPTDRVIIHDLTKPMDTLPIVDVATCWEVCEHIEPEYIDIFINTLVLLSNTLVISICCYGPTTKLHPSVFPISFWLKRFEQRGFHRKPEKELLLREKWETIKGRGAVKEQYKNLIIFERTL